MLKKYVFIPLICTMLLAGCSNTKGNDSQVKGADNTFVMLKDVSGEDDTYYTSDVYIKYEGKDEEKIASGIYRDSIREYLEGDNSIIMQDKENNLYKYSSDGDKEKIGTDLMEILSISETDTTPYEVSSNNETIAYITSDESLYIKYPNKDKEKVASSVYYYEVDNTGNYLYYLNLENELYVYDNKGEKNKISSDVQSFIISDSGEKVAFLTNDEILYTKNIGSDEKIKINSGAIDIYSVGFYDDDSITYLNDYNGEKGELYIYPKKDDKSKIASDIKLYGRIDDKFYYINSEDVLCEKMINEDKSTTIASDVQDIILIDNGIIYINKDGDIYTKENNKEAVKIGNNIMDTDKISIVDDNEIVYLMKDNELFRGKDKIATEVLNYVSNSKIVAYVTKNKEIHSYNIKSKQDKVEISDAKSYSQIYLEDQFLFSNTLEPYEVAGFWKVNSEMDGEYILEFSGSNKLIRYFSEGNKEVINYKISFSEKDYFSATAQGDYEGSLISVARDDENNITVVIDAAEECPAVKISKEEANSIINGTAETNISTDSLNEDSNRGSGDIEDQIKNLIQDYEYDYVKAVNSGDAYIVTPHLVYNGKLYKDHSKNIYDYYERGISETLYEAKVQNIEEINDRECRVKVYEKIGIIKEGKEDVKEFNATYIVEFDGDKWLIREML